jgi:predicted GH43/DUF377 family glycosyl hydrolase
MKRADTLLDRRDFLRTVGVATGAAALTRTLLSALAAAPRGNGMAGGERPEGSAAKQPPLFEKDRPDWEIKFADVSNSVMSVMPGESNKTFYDPLIKREVKWEQDAVCTACTVLNDKLYCVYRSWGGDKQWRMGLAWSDDGLHFSRSDKPVLYAKPEDTFLGSLRDLKEDSVTYGDSRIYQDEKGTIYLFFNFLSYNPQEHPAMQELAVATTRDMEHWTVHGRAFAKQAGRDADVIPGVKASRFWPAIVTRLEAGRLVPARINGKYWMYLSNVAAQFSDGFVATSENMLDWEIYRDVQGQHAKVLALRPGYFYSNWIDPVAPVLREDGILLIYNGVNAEPKKGGDPRRPPLTHYPGQALFDKNDPTRLLKRGESPFKGGDKELEKRPLDLESWSAPLYEAWSLVPFKNELLLYWNHVFGRRSVGLWKGPIPDSMKNVSVGK